MPKLRRLNGKEVLAILRRFGFDVVRIRGSHHTLRRVVSGVDQMINIPVHGNSPLPIGTLKGIYNQAKDYVPEADLRVYFYTD